MSRVGGRQGLKMGPIAHTTTDKLDTNPSPCGESKQP